MEYPRQLERIINSRRPDLHVEVVNVAYAGQSLRTFSHRVDSTVDTLSPRIAIIYPGFIGYINDASIGQPDQLDWVREPKGFHSRIVEKSLSSYGSNAAMGGKPSLPLSHLARPSEKQSHRECHSGISRRQISLRFTGLFWTACRHATCVLFW